MIRPSIKATRPPLARFWTCSCAGNTTFHRSGRVGRRFTSGRRTRLAVLLNRFGHAAGEHRLPAVDEHAVRAEIEDGREVMRDEHERDAAVEQFAHPRDTARLEARVADAQHLVDDEHVGVEIRGDRFTATEWKEFLLRSVGFEPGQLSSRAQDVLLLRMIPFVVHNYNMVEIGPRGTIRSNFSAISARFMPTIAPCR